MSHEQQRNKGRLVLLSIAGIPLVMVLASTWLWYYVVDGDLDLVGMLGTANRGELVEPPRALDDYALLDEDGQPYHYADAEPKWTLLIPGAGNCGADCETLLYTTRQIHVAMGKHFNRIRRLYLSQSSVEATALEVATLSDDRPAPDTFASYLKLEQRGLKALKIEAGGVDTLFPEYGGDPSTWYLVDPAGWVMMSYNSSIGYKDVMADLKFLLKNTSE